MAMTESGTGGSVGIARVGAESLIPAEIGEQEIQHSIDRALMDVYGSPDMRQLNRGEDLRRASIVESGYASSDRPDSSVRAYAIDPPSGSIVMAEGETEIAALTAAKGFRYAMRLGQTQHAKTVAKALGLVEQGLHGIPKAIGMAQRYLPKKGPATASATGVQLFDNKLIVNGRRPVFAYDLQTGDCTWTNRGGDRRPGNYLHLLNLGQHILVMTGEEPDDSLGTLKVGRAIEEILSEQTEDSPHTAQSLADALHASLNGSGSKGALLVSVLNLEPWQDRRPLWKKLGDYIFRLPSTAMYGVAAFAVEKKRRQLYETRTTAGRLGRGMAITADLAFDVGFLAFAYTMVRSSLGAAEEAAGLLKPGGNLSAAGGQHYPPIGTPPVAEQPPPTPPHVVEAYPTLRTAIEHDPLSGGKPSTVSNWSQDTLRYDGRQEGLPEAEIDKLAHDPVKVNEVNNAFYHDQSNPNNTKVAEDPEHLLNARDQYSQLGQVGAAHHIVLEIKHELGLDTPPPSPVEPTTPVPTTPDPPTIVATAPAAPEQHSLTELLNDNWPAVAAAGSAGLLTFGAAARNRRKRRRKRAALVETIKGGRLIRTHNPARRTSNANLLAAGHLPPRGLSSKPLTPVSVLEDMPDDEIAEEFLPVAVPTAALLRSRHPIDSNTPRSRFDHTT